MFIRTVQPHSSVRRATSTHRNWGCWLAVRFVFLSLGNATLAAPACAYLPSCLSATYQHCRLRVRLSHYEWTVIFSAWRACWRAFGIDLPICLTHLLSRLPAVHACLCVACLAVHATHIPGAPYCRVWRAYAGMLWRRLCRLCLECVTFLHSRLRACCCCFLFFYSSSTTSNLSNVVFT